MSKLSGDDRGINSTPPGLARPVENARLSKHILVLQPHFVSHKCTL
jgi:hypothetical protein